MKKPGSYLLVLAAVGLLAAACGGDDLDDSGDVGADESTDSVDEGGEGEADDAASSGGDEPASGVDLDALYESALEEGSLIAYVASAEGPFLDTIDAFGDRYPGIDVEFVRLSSAAIAQRFGTELESGSPTADLALYGNPPFALQAREEGWFVPPEQLPLPEEFPDEFISPELGPIVGSPLSMTVYNTELVAEGDVPTTWEELADPKWKNEILIYDLGIQVWNVGVFGTVIETLGEEWADGIRANEPRVVTGQIEEQIAAGEAAVGLIAYAPFVEALKASGAPIDYVTPDPQTAVPALIDVNSEADNPNAARLFYHYLHTQEGIEGYSLVGTHAPYQASRDYQWIPDDFRWFTDEEYVAETRQLMGQ